MFKVYGDIQSGNCYKVKLLMNMLGIDHEWIAVDILNGDTRTESFAVLNPNTKIPLLQIDTDKSLAESNAILNYLAAGSSLLPEGNYKRSLMLQWQFFEQYSHEPYIATARFINKYLGLPDDRKEEYQAKQSGGHKALQVMEAQLSAKEYLIGEQLTIADISLFAYTHVADEGGFELADYPAIRHWLEKISMQPGFISMADAARQLQSLSE